MLLNTEISFENLQYLVHTRTPRRLTDIVSLAFLTDPNKAKIIASNTSWLVVSFSNIHVTCEIAKELGENKTWETFIFPYGCTFEDGVFLYLENSNTKNLFLHDSKLTKKNILEIMSCSKWENLDFSGCNLSDEVLPIILKEKSWKIINLSMNNFSEENYKNLIDLDNLYFSYMFSETMSIEEKEEKCKSIYTTGGALHHVNLIPM